MFTSQNAINLMEKGTQDLISGMMGLLFGTAVG